MLKDLVTFINKLADNRYPENKLVGGIERSVSEALAYYCVDKWEELTAVAFAVETKPGHADIWFIGGNVKDFSFIFKQFRKLRPDIQYLTGNRKGRKVCYSVDALAKKF